MDKELEDKLRYLRLPELLHGWDETMAHAKAKGPSYPAFTKQLIDREYAAKRERARLLRLRGARIDEPFGIETYPFERQPNLQKRKVMEPFDSMNYIDKKQNMLFVGPTGVGKTGLATSLLIHAINKGYTGRFITFPQLLDELYQSVADHTEKHVLGRYAAYDCLVCDELGYIEIDPHQAGLFFTLMKRRHKKATTIITSQLGFKDWAGFLKNTHLVTALIDRFTENCQVFNMLKCVSIRNTVEPDKKD